MSLSVAAGAVIAAGIGAAVNSILQVTTNAQNKDLQETSWDKMSISQRVKELEANGLNKQLASGAAPNYSLQTSMKAPEINTGKIVDAMFGYADNKRKDTLAEQEAEKFAQEKKMWETQEEILKSQKEKAKYDALLSQYQSALLKHDFDIFKERGITSRDTGLAREISNLASLIQNFLDGKGISMSLDSIKEWLKKQEVKKEILDNLDSFDENNQEVSENYTNNKPVRTGKRQLVFNASDQAGAGHRAYEEAKRGGYSYNGANSRK